VRAPGLTIGQRYPQPRRSGPATTELQLERAVVVYAQPDRLVDSVGEHTAAHHRREIDEGPGDAGDRDTLERRDIGARQAGAAHVDPDGAPTATRWNHHLDAGPRGLGEPPVCSRRPVREDRTVAAGQYRGEPEAFGAQDPVPDGVHPAVQAHEPSDADEVCDVLVGHPAYRELPAGHDAELPRRELHDLPIWPTSPNLCKF